MPHKKRRNHKQDIATCTRPQYSRVRTIQHFSHKNSSRPDPDKAIKATFVHLHGLPTTETAAINAIGMQDNLAFIIPHHPLLIEVLHKLMTNKCYDTIKRVHRILQTTQSHFTQPHITANDLYSMVPPHTNIVTVTPDPQDDSNRHYLYHTISPPSDLFQQQHH